MKRLILLFILFLSTFAFADTTTTTTNSTTTTEAPTTTTTLYVETAPPSNSILWMYALIIPWFAVVFTVCMFAFQKQPIPAILATTCWLASSMWTTRIRFINNFTVSMSPYYIDVGNNEVGSLFLAFGIICGIYTALLILDRFFTGSTGEQKNG